MSEEGRNQDLDALKDGATLLLQSGNRIAALSLLWSAVAIDPYDLASHRRLAATLANGGDLDGAAHEFARYIEFMIPRGEVGRATLELQYGVQMLGVHDALRSAAEKIVDAVHALVRSNNVALAAPVIDTTPFPAPRLLPKVPFRFCLHEGAAQHWMQLEGGSDELVPESVRIVDADENVIEERPCLPLGRGEGHGPLTLDAPPVAWVVMTIPNNVAAQIDAGMKWEYALQAKVGDEWLALDLADTGCRLGRRAASVS